jgi:putative membrane protein
MPRFLVHWLSISAALAITAWLLPGVHIANVSALLVAALVLGFLNAVLKPILILVTLPLTLLTLGIFYFILNAIVFALASVLAPGFTVEGFGSAFLGAILMSILSSMLSHFTRRREEEEERF